MPDLRFAAIGEELLRAGLAPRRVRRILFELGNHMDDLVEELEDQGLSREEAVAEATKRLHAEAIIQAARERTELHSGMRRWPAAAFTLLPLFTYAAVFVGALFLVTLGLTFAKDVGFPVEHSVLLQQITTATFAGVELLLPASVAITFCMLASARRAPLSWTLVGVALVSLLGATANAQLDLPPASQPAIGAGLGFSTEAMGAPLIRAASTFLFVLLLYLWHTRKLRRTA
jgi:uncharacterized protein YjiS (DUF1127 family)